MPERMDHSAIIDAINESPLNRGLDGAAWLASKGNVPVVMGEDIALFDDVDSDGTFEVHFLFASRGRAAIDAAKESFRRMFEQHGAELIIGLIPAARRDVKLIARWAGGKFAGQRSTTEGPCDLFVLSKEMWSN